MSNTNYFRQHNYDSLSLSTDDNTQIPVSNWSREEDDLLQSLVMQSNGTNVNWGIIATNIQSIQQGDVLKNDFICENRWNTLVERRGVKRQRQWTAVEDLTISQSINEV